MKTKLAVLGLVVVFGAFFIVKGLERNRPDPVAEGEGPMIVRSGTDFPSREGRICGLLPLQDALDLTGEPFEALFESTIFDGFRDTETLIQQELFLNCLVAVSKSGYRTRKAILVLASSQKKQERTDYVGYDE
ncbi:MAG: hypothetical protein ACRC0L_00455, partial [Angustibacter sp.]